MHWHDVGDMGCCGSVDRKQAPSNAVWLPHPVQQCLFDEFRPTHHGQNSQLQRFIFGLFRNGDVFFLHSKLWKEAEIWKKPLFRAYYWFFPHEFFLCPFLIFCAFSLARSSHEITTGLIWYLHRFCKLVTSFLPHFSPSVFLSLNLLFLEWCRRCSVWQVLYMVCSQNW